jgi:hypothetical protein
MRSLPDGAHLAVLRSFAACSALGSVDRGCSTSNPSGSGWSTRGDDPSTMVVTFASQGPPCEVLDSFEVDEVGTRVTITLFHGRDPDADPDHPCWSPRSDLPGGGAPRGGLRPPGPRHTHQRRGPDRRPVINRRRSLHKPRRRLATRGTARHRRGATHPRRVWGATHRGRTADRFGRRPPLSSAR